MYKDINETGTDESDEEEDYNEMSDQTEDKSENNDNEDKIGVECDTGEDNDDGDEIANETTNTTISKLPPKRPSYKNDIPKKQFFPGFMSFVTYGPFPDVNGILACFSISNDSTDDFLSRFSKCKTEISENTDDRLNGNNHTRGYPTNQRFTREASCFQQLAHEQTTHKSDMMALIAHQTAIVRQIEVAERRATVRYNDYDPKNIYWKNCDNLIAQQSELNQNIANFTKNTKLVSIEDQTNNEDETNKCISCIAKFIRK